MNNLEQEAECLIFEDPSVYLDISGITAGILRLPFLFSGFMSNSFKY